jgi:hypothetical protein
MSCPQCNNDFAPKRPTQLFCTPHCQKQWQKTRYIGRRSKARLAEKEERQLRRTHCIHGHPLTPDNLRGGKRLTAGYRECLICHRLGELKRNHAAGVKPRNPNRTHCPHGHPLTPENLKASKRGGLACLTCHRKRERERQASDRERFNRRSREYARAHKADARERSKRWRQQNIERYREIGREQARKRSLRRNPEAVEYATHVLANDRCCYCGGPCEAIDHIMPISRGGPADAVENLTSACMSCNSRKRSRTLIEFLLYELQDSHVARGSLPPPVRATIDPSRQKKSGSPPQLPNHGPTIAGV